MHGPRTNNIIMLDLQSNLPMGQMGSFYYLVDSNDCLKLSIGFAQWLLRLDVSYMKFSSSLTL